MGKPKITKMAQRISPYLEPEEFATYLDAFSDATAQQIIDTFTLYWRINCIQYAWEDGLLFLWFNLCAVATTEKKKGTPKSAQNVDVKISHNILEEKIIASGQAVANAWNAAVSNLTLIRYCRYCNSVHHHSKEYPYSSEDKILVQEFTSDYDK